jgi:hypothetical protein
MLIKKNKNTYYSIHSGKGKKNPGPIVGSEKYGYYG